MTNPESVDDRRSFASRTPVNDNPDKVVYRRGFVTRHQVSGWRFVMRRIASGVALHDTRMLVDPLRTQTRAVLMGVLMLITALFPRSGNPLGHFFFEAASGEALLPRELQFQPGKNVCNLIIVQLDADDLDRAFGA